MFLCVAGLAKNSTTSYSSCLRESCAAGIILQSYQRIKDFVTYKVSNLTAGNEYMKSTDAVIGNTNNRDTLCIYSIKKDYNGRS